jgi:hypothetical protein
MSHTGLNTFGKGKSQGVVAHLVRWAQIEHSTVLTLFWSAQADMAW